MCTPQEVANIPSSSFFPLYSRAERAAARGTGRDGSHQTPLPSSAWNGFTIAVGTSWLKIAETGSAKCKPKGKLLGKNVGSLTGSQGSPKNIFGSTRAQAAGATGQPTGLPTVFRHFIILPLIAVPGRNFIFLYIPRVSLGHQFSCPLVIRSTEHSDSWSRWRGIYPSRKKGAVDRRWELLARQMKIQPIISMHLVQRVA